MRFFDRTEEIASLRKIREMAKNNAQFTVVTGRRRIGKTSLVWKAYEDEPILYFFVARKAEGDLCEDYRLEIENKLGVPTMGRAEHFTDVFEYLMKLSAERPITLFIDEFQEFFRVNKSVFSDMQRIWDLYSPKSRINLIVCGSIYSMMTKIFKDKKEPLYNRQSRFMTVRPFTPNCSERYSFGIQPRLHGGRSAGLVRFHGRCGEVCTTTHGCRSNNQNDYARPDYKGRLHIFGRG